MMDLDEINATCRFVLIVALALAAWLLSLRAYDVWRGRDDPLPRRLRFCVAAGWAIAAMGIGLQRFWWWLSWAVQIQDGDPKVFREYAHLAIAPDVVAIIGLSLAVAPYASRIWPDRWHWIAIGGLPAIILASTVAVHWIAA